jgi:hypothetical protein
MIWRNTFTRFLARRLQRRVQIYMIEHEPTQIIGGIENPYLFRWCLAPKNRFGNIYLHLIVRDDDDRALHDHPFDSVSIVLDGPLSEIRRCKHGDEIREFKAGDIVFRSASAAHRLFLDRRGTPAVTCFFVGPRRRQWGFLCPSRWVHWKEFTAYSVDGDGNRVGRGCGEA